MNTTTYTEDDRASDVILVHLARMMSRNVPMRDAFLADQTPAFRDAYWAEVDAAHERLGIQ